MDKSQLERRHEYFEKSSMNNWYPKVKDLNVRTPETRKVELEKGEDTRHRYEIPVEKIQEKAERLGTPVFVRTDQASNKHRMNKASKIQSMEAKEIAGTVRKLFEFNEMAGIVGLPYDTVYLREWLDLEHKFEAFGGTPIAKEVRFFVNNGNILYYHFYWPKEALKFRNRYEKSANEPENWEDDFTELYNETIGEAPLIKEQVRTVAAEFDGFWSIDFAKTENGHWYLIDMAKGEVSWHPNSERGKILETVEDYKDSYERELVD